MVEALTDPLAGPLQGASSGLGKGSGGKLRGTAIHQGAKR